MGETMQPSAEVELKLLVVSEQPRETADLIAALDVIGPHRLGPVRYWTIHDRFFDTPGRAIKRLGGVLRLRLSNNRLYVTLKGARREIGAAGGVSRAELEAPWSAQGWRAVGRMLRDLRVEVPLAAWSDDAGAVLCSSGFVATGELWTDRRTRDVLGSSGAVSAELTIDMVRFKVSGRELAAHVIEVEAKGAGDARLVVEVSGLLVARFGGVLEPWPFGKIATMKAAARLAVAGVLGEMAGGVLGPEAIGRIRAELDRRARGAGG